MRIDSYNRFAFFYHFSNRCTARVFAPQGAYKFDSAKSRLKFYYIYKKKTCYSKSTL